MKKGFSLINIIFVITILLILGAILTRVVLNSMITSENKTLSLQAFYLAEAGIEKIKYELKKNPNWYTDLAHSPPNDIDWIKSKAKEGSFAMIKEYQKNRAYAIGKTKKSVRIIKIEFDLNPFKQKSWKIL